MIKMPAIDEIRKIDNLTDGHLCQVMRLILTGKSKTTEEILKRNSRGNIGIT
jgi:hypothetical protein